MSPGEEQYGIDVCIVSYRSAEVLGRALAAVAAHIPGANVYLREHGDDPGALDDVANAQPMPVTVDADPSNPGFAAGCNALARRSSAPWLLFLNPDAEVRSWPWSADRPPPLRQVTGPHMVGDGESARQSGRSYRVRDEIGRSWLRRTGPPPDGVGFVSGAALLVDRESFERVGGFDEGYFMFYEDIDLCVRLNSIGVGTRIEPAWRVEHRGAHATSERFGDALTWSYESACRFHGRDGSGLVGYRAYVVIDSVLRAGLSLVKRDATRRRAYGSLARRAARSYATCIEGSASARNSASTQYPPDTELQ